MASESGFLRIRLSTRCKVLCTGAFLAEQPQQKLGPKDRPYTCMHPYDRNLQDRDRDAGKVQFMEEAGCKALSGQKMFLAIRFFVQGIFHDGTAESCGLCGVSLSGAELVGQLCHSLLCHLLLETETKSARPTPA